MAIRIYALAVSLMFAATYADSVDAGCHQCLETATQGDCADCAHHVRQVMLNSDESHLTKLMHTLRDRSHTRCLESSLDSRACQIYLSLCDGDNQCDGELFHRVLEHRDRRFGPKRHVA